MVFQRIPPSPQYAGLAQRFIAALLERPGGTQYVEVVSGAGEPEDAGGLTTSERAFQRAMYYELNSTGGVVGPRGGRSAPNPDWSLMRGWGRPRYDRPGGLFGFLRPAQRRRWVYLTIVPKAEARAAVRYRPGLWVDNPAEQSGGLGSVKQRLP